MRKISKIIVSIFFIIALTACSSHGNCISDTYIEYFGDDDNITLLKNYEEYMDYMDKIYSCKVSENYKNQLEKYDEEYFDENMLAVIYHWETTGSAKLEVESIEYSESDIKIIIERDTPDIVTDDMCAWGIFVDLEKNEKYTTVVYDIVE